MASTAPGSRKWQPCSTTTFRQAGANSISQQKKKTLFQDSTVRAVVALWVLTKKGKANRASPCTRTRRVHTSVTYPRPPEKNTSTQHQNKYKHWQATCDSPVHNYCSPSRCCCTVPPTNLDQEAKSLHDVTGRCAAEHSAQPAPRHLQLLDEQHSRPKVLALRHLDC